MDLQTNHKQDQAATGLGGRYRRTVAGDVHLQGLGVHSGEQVNLHIFPAPAGTGLVFRPQGQQEGQIEISPLTVVDTIQAVTISNGNWRVSTVEHLLCGLAVAGVTDAFMEIDAEEVPILDGSALPFYEAVMSTGTVDLDAVLEPIRLTAPIWVVQEDKYIIALPHDGFRVTYGISFDHPLLQGQSFSMDLDAESCVTELLSARTFGFERDVEMLRSKGLARGASLDNAVVLSKDGYLNESLRYEDECIRHKVLDLIGDLYLLGRPIQAHIIASRAGHTLDVALGKNIAATFGSDELVGRRLPEGIEKTAFMTQF